MDIEAFDSILRAAKAARPGWFPSDPEPACSNEEISELESKLGMKLPGEYKLYLAKYGGGYIGYINVFSASPESDWYLPTCNRFLTKECNFIAVTDDQTGGYYGFVVDKSGCSDSVYYWAPDDEPTPTFTATSFLDYVASVGLSKIQ